MEGVRIEKDVVNALNLISGLFRHRTRVVVCTMKLQKKEEIPAVLLCGTLHIK